MPLLPDGDLAAFLWTMAVVIFTGKARIQKNTRAIPRQYDLREIAESQLTEAQTRYLKPIDAQLEALNYRPECTFRAGNYGQNLMRRYANPADPASCELTVVEVKSKAGQVETARNVNTVSFATRLSDGQRLITRNMPLKSVMDRPPHHIMQECPNTTNVATLKKKHDVRAATLGPGLSPPHGANAIFSEIQHEHERFIAHQLAQGIIQLSPDGSSYQITAKVANRGIRNFFHPFGRRMAPSKVLFTALVGAVVPLFGILKLAPAVAYNLHDPSLGLFSPVTLTIAGCYALAGGIIGLSGGPSSYTWIMAVTYLPAHFVAAWSFGWMPYSTIAHAVAFYVRQARQRRGLVLQS
jgi:hypothetical protein